MSNGVPEMNRTTLRRILAEEGITASEQEADKLDAEAEASEEQAEADRAKADAARMAARRYKVNEVPWMNPDQAMDSLGDIAAGAGRKAKEYLDLARSEVWEKEDYIDRLEKAWGAWDWDALYDMNIVTRNERDFAKEVLAHGFGSYDPLPGSRRASVRTAYSISRTFDRYEKMPVWTVYDLPPSHQAAQFPASVYGERKAKALAEYFLRRLQKSGNWAAEYAKLPEAYM